MLFIIALVTVLLFMLYDYKHDQVNWSLKNKDTWPKYAVGLGIGWFYAAIQAIKFFQYVQEAGVVVLAGLGAALILKWLSFLWRWIKLLINKKP